MIPMKILITGSNGLLGQAVAALINRETNYELILTSAEEKSYVEYRGKYEQLDITAKEDVKRIVAFYQPNVIVNCAAFTNVDLCETERELSWRINVDGVKNLIIACRKENCRLIHISTDYIFDGKNGPYTEESTPNPISFYGRSKLAAENAITTSTINYVILRTMVLFGVGEKIKNNFALWMINELKNNKPIKIVDDMIGNSTMVDDLAYAVLKSIEKNLKGIYNIAGPDIISRYDFAMILCDVFKFDKKFITRIKTKDLQQAAARPLNSGLIIYKAQTEMGLKPMDTLEALRLLKVQLGE